MIAYDGSASQLDWSLLATFAFLILHMSVDPFVNKQLNEFQKHVLISQFLTTFGAIVFLLKGVYIYIHIYRHIYIYMHIHIYA